MFARVFGSGMATADSRGDVDKLEAKRCSSTPGTLECTGLENHISMDRQESTGLGKRTNWT